MVLLLVKHLMGFFIRVYLSKQFFEFLVQVIIYKLGAYWYLPLVKWINKALICQEANRLWSSRFMIYWSFVVIFPVFGV